MWDNLKQDEGSSFVFKEFHLGFPDNKKEYDQSGWEFLGLKSDNFLKVGNLNQEILMNMCISAHM